MFAEEKTKKIKTYPSALHRKPKRRFPLIPKLNSRRKNLDPFAATVIVLNVLTGGYAREEDAGGAVVRDVEVVVVLDGLIK